MPEYLAPGVYIEETSYRPKTIEGVSTSTAGFVGPTRFSPIGGEPELLTSFSQFERIYGGIDNLSFAGQPESTNYMAHAVRSFFDNGGSRLYVTRIYQKQRNQQGDEIDGNAEYISDGSPPSIRLRARFPGSGGNMTVTFALKATPRLASNLSEFDVVFIKEPATGSPQSPGNPIGEGLYDVVRQNNSLVFSGTDGGSSPPNDPRVEQFDPQSNRLYLITLAVRVRPTGAFAEEVPWGEVFSPSPKPEKRNSLLTVFTEKPRLRRWQLTVPFAIVSDIQSGAELTRQLMGPEVLDSLTKYLDTDREFDDRQSTLSSPPDEPPPKPGPQSLERSHSLESGSDGILPSPIEYMGRERENVKTGLESFVDIDDISIVAAPGSTTGYSEGVDNQRRINQITENLINHCRRMRYRIAVIDAPDNQMISEVRDFRSRFDSSHAALYYPWVTVLDPLDPDASRELQLPPSGFVAGINARNDVEFGVHKAPANEIVQGAIGFEYFLNKPQQDILNPDGINCFRFFENRGYRLWGARTVSSDPEWKYVNLRRYFIFLEHSIDRSTQWVVFRPNNRLLWNNVRQTIGDFLYNEWRSGHLMGESPEQAYFVKCDLSTMTQNDLDNGRLVCEIGVAAVRPAEFVIFRIGQWTADSQR